ncbi:DUF4959 domain-containing protein [Prolixibacteraceae bacterium JC049]|nr:DUF4959 domain-containing protein [Prolixibacteraceae bacterium JC049]
MNDLKINMTYKNRFINYLFISLLAVIAISCGEEKEYGPIYGDNIAPKPVSNVEVTNLNGKAIVKYQIPNERDLAYVLAVFEPAPGIKREMKASIYSNSILLDGFYKSEEFKVDLYMVDIAELKSQPVSVNVNPDTPEYTVVGNSVAMEPDFGGPRIEWENASREEMLFFCYAADSTGKMKKVDSFVSTQEVGSYTVRGFDDTERRFAVIVQDKWHNKTDSLFSTLTPKKEIELDRDLWELYKGFKDDTDLFSDEKYFNRLRDDNYNSYWKTKYGANPSHLSYTIDLGVEATFSRIKMWHDEGAGFTGSRFKIIQLYGSNELVSEWEAWTPLHDGPYEVVKPSGLPGKNKTEEDKEALKNGFEILMKPGIGSFRYLRIKYIENFENRTASATCSELKVFGEVKSE